MITGVLEVDSPSLFSSLQRLAYTADNKERITDGAPPRDRLLNLYKAAVELGAGEDPAVDREAGVRFNPRPARLAELLISPGGVRDPELLGASFFAAISADAASSCCGDFEAEFKLGTAARKLFNAEHEGTANEEVRLIALSLALDTLRHLHMIRMTEATTRSHLGHAKALLEGSIRTGFDRYITAAVTRWENRLAQ